MSRLIINVNTLVLVCLVDTFPPNDHRPTPTDRVFFFFEDPLCESDRLPLKRLPPGGVTDDQTTGNPYNLAGRALSSISWSILLLCEQYDVLDYGLDPGVIGNKHSEANVK
ncbi:hypothetical protein RSOLAG1IB_09006 [Rhizoctonia solani AG-1 IB]|uniref:Uncharacterized protein n=1 Tax=Thanatephorus cucumeris (strain AG1-IB / isolate 7/3/14) TaxID=1108050 RepID=A0A0B7FS07_THACB|nr:hypothetical protein RSOLAG1IB_09006 [Rhizoctonia solani AG-1 IB]